MSEKKGFLNRLFGRNSSGGCCDMQIIEETVEADENSSNESEISKDSR